MKFTTGWVFLAWMAWLNTESVRAAESCDSSSRAYVCDVKDGEDLVRLPGTPWVVASSVNIVNSSFPLRRGLGPLQLIDIDTRRVTLLYPAAKNVSDWDRKTYPDCAAPPKMFSSGGLNVRRLGPNTFRLYAVNNGDREAIEIIDVAIHPEGVRPAWRGCILAPKGIEPNSVAFLPENGVAVSGGSVAVWKPGRGWNSIGHFKGSNGLEASTDGRWLFVALPSRNAVARISMTDESVREITLEFHPDNLRWGEDGQLYSAGPRPPKDGDIHDVIVSCLARTVCDTLGFGVARIDPKSLVATTLYRSDGIANAFGAATAALRIGGEIWVGTVFGDRLLVVNAP